MSELNNISKNEKAIIIIAFIILVLFMLYQVGRFGHAFFDNLTGKFSDKSGEIAKNTKAVLDNADTTNATLTDIQAQNIADASFSILENMGIFSVKKEGANLMSQLNLITTIGDANLVQQKFGVRANTHFLTGNTQLSLMQWCTMQLNTEDLVTATGILTHGNVNNIQPNDTPQNGNFQDNTFNQFNQ